MSLQTFPNWAVQPGLLLVTFAIDGSAVGATSSTDGLDGRGKMFCLIKKSANRVTIDYKVAFAEAPYVDFTSGVGQNNTAYQIVSSTAQQLVFDSVECGNSANPVNDADLYVKISGYTTTSFVG